METGYIEYNNRLVKVTILEKKSQHTTVKTEDNELLCIPREAYVVIWPTKKLFKKYQKEGVRIFIDPVDPLPEEEKYIRETAYIESHAR